MKSSQHPSEQVAINDCKVAQISKKIFAWLDRIVIEYDFCPFAKFVRKQGVKIDVCFKVNLDDILQAVYDACKHLDEDSSTATTLITFSDALLDFDEFLFTVDIAQQMMKSWQYEGVYQIASFHPDYLFSGESPSSPSNFTNRSPLPIMHLIREADIEIAVEKYDKPELIPERNIALANKLGCAHFKNILDNINKD